MYKGRWWLFNPFSRETHKAALWWCPWSFRIHHIMRHDEDLDLHDHPWNARTIILRGWYTEQRPAGGEWKKAVMAGMVSNPEQKWVDWVMKDACEWIKRD